PRSRHVFYFSFNSTATTEFYTLSLHDALPIYVMLLQSQGDPRQFAWSSREDHTDWNFASTTNTAGFLNLETETPLLRGVNVRGGDRKSTRLNSSHVKISYAVFCLKKKKNNTNK